MENFVEVDLGFILINVRLDDSFIEVTNLPVDTTETHIRKAFEHIAEIEIVEFFNNEFPIQLAFPLFKQQNVPLLQANCYCKVFYSSIHPNAKSLVSSLKWPSLSLCQNTANVEESEQEATAILEFFDYKTSNEPIVDDDGFTLVESKKKFTPNKRSLEKTDFYKFQITDNKRKRINELQEKFNSDKERLLKQKQNKSLLSYIVYVFFIVSLSLG